MTDYRENSMFEMSNLFGPYDNPIVLRDSDSDGSPGPIDCVRTRGLNLKQKWLGDTVHLTNTVTQTFEILLISIFNSNE